MSERSISQLIKDIQADGQALVKEESALAKAEATAGAKKLGIGAGLAIAGLFLLFLGSFIVVFMLVAIFHEAVGLSWWLSALIVLAILFVLAAVLVGIAVPFLKKGNPTPTTAINSGKSALNAFKRALTNPSGPRVVDTHRRSGAAGRRSTAGAHAAGYGKADYRMHNTGSTASEEYRMRR